MEILIILLVLLCLFLCYAVWQYFELKKFEVTEYQILSDKLCSEHRVAVIADLHGFEYGRANERLLQKIRESSPGAILIAGDMVVSKEPESYRKAGMLLRQLVKIAPVYYSFGNHESRASKKGLVVSEHFAAYIREMKEIGVRFLQNENTVMEAEGDRLSIGGIEIPLGFYEKGSAVSMDMDYVEQLMGPIPKGAFQILLAHNPMYSEQYAAWGADVTFCGHNHGGLVRIPGIGSLLSPQLTLFPKYNDGLYEIQGRKVIVSRGLGTHTFHVRVFNRAELITVRLLPNTLEKSEVNG